MCSSVVERPPLSDRCAKSTALRAPNEIGERIRQREIAQTPKCPGPSVRLLTVEYDVVARGDFPELLHRMAEPVEAAAVTPSPAGSLNDCRL